MVRSLSQIRAEHAFHALSTVDKETRKRASELGQTLIQNGLFAAWAFHLKKGSQHLTVLRSLHGHLKSIAPQEVTTNDPRTEFLRWVAPEGGLNGPTLRRLTGEAIAYAEWLKRAAQALDED